jgi:hypothetical protein
MCGVADRWVESKAGKAAGSRFDQDLLSRLNQVSQPHSYADISRMTGFHRETCRRYLTLGNPTVEFMTALCEALGVSVHWLLLGVGPVRREEVTGEWLRTVRPAELILELGRRWQDLHERLAEVQARLERLEAAAGALQDGER